MNFDFFSDLSHEVDIPSQGICSRTLIKNDAIKAVIFGFAAGEELSEHTAAVPAVVQVIKGEAKFGIDNDFKSMTAGSIIYMDAHLPHSVFAQTELVLLVHLLRSVKHSKPSA